MAPNLPSSRKTMSIGLSRKKCVGTGVTTAGIAVTGAGVAAIGVGAGVGIIAAGTITVIGEARFRSKPLIA